MAENQEKTIDVKFITSFALSVNDIDDVVKHIQIVLCQEFESKKFRCFMDVVDPSKIHIQPDENELP